MYKFKANCLKINTALDSNQFADLMHFTKVSLRIKLTSLPKRIDTPCCILRSRCLNWKRINDEIVFKLNERSISNRKNEKNKENLPTFFYGLFLILLDPFYIGLHVAVFKLPTPFVLFSIYFL